MASYSPHIVAFLSLTLLLSSLFPASARADEGLEDALHRRDNDEHHREYSFNIHGEVADIRAEGLDFRISLRAADGPKISASYHTEDGTERYKFKMFIKRIVEYIPDSNDGYQKGRDQVVKIYGSGTGEGAGDGGGSTWDFGPFIDVNPGSTTDRRFYAITTDGLVNVSFRVNVPPGESLADSNVTIGLNDIKFDVNIDMEVLHNLSFLERNDTEIAIVGVLQSRLRIRFCDSNSTNSTDSTNSSLSNATISDNTDDDGSVCVEDEIDGSTQGYLRWLNELNCNNTNVSLQLTRVEDDDSEGDSDMDSEGSHATVISWTLSDPFNATGICKWDPIFHLSSSTAAGSSATAIASTLSSAFALLGIAVALMH